jgi:site-specific recombinase XerD
MKYLNSKKTNKSLSRNTNKYKMAIMKIYYQWLANKNMCINKKNNYTVTWSVRCRRLKDRRWKKIRL